jgi:hypothetical protein
VALGRNPLFIREGTTPNCVTAVTAFEAINTPYLDEIEASFNKNTINE